MIEEKKSTAALRHLNFFIFIFIFLYSLTDKKTFTEISKNVKTMYPVGSFHSQGLSIQSLHQDHEILGQYSGFQIRII
jgi:hypothetical protein